MVTGQCAICHRLGDSAHMLVAEQNWESHQAAHQQAKFEFYKAEKQTDPSSWEPYRLPEGVTHEAAR